LITWLLPSAWGAVNFQGDADYINCGDLGDLGSQYTCGVVFKTDTVAENNLILSYRTNDQADQTRLPIQLDHNNADMRFLVRDDDSDLAIVTKAGVLNNTDFFAVVGVRDGTTINLYVNNEAVGTDTDGALDAVITMNICGIGAFYDDLGNSWDTTTVFNGIIAEVFIVNTAWSADKARSWINSKLKRHSFILGDDSVAYWSLDELPDGGASLSGATFNDLSGNGNTGSGVDADNDSLGVGETILSYQ